MAQGMNRRTFVGSAAAAAVTAGLAGLASAAATPPQIKIIGIAGSLRKGKNTANAVKIALDSAKAVNPGISTELIELSGLNLDPYLTVKARFVDKDDDFPALQAKLAAPEVRGVILASPVYMGLISSPMKAFIERCMAFRQAGFTLRDKVGAGIAVGAGRNNGIELILQQLAMFMISQDMVVVGDGKPTSHWGGYAWAQNDDITKDEAGLATIRGVGKRVAELAVRLAAAG
jgi:multimeric flavodoxin WrbA